MDGDKSGESGAFLFSGRWSAIIPNKSKPKFVLSGTSPMDFAHYQSPKLLGSSPPIRNKHGVSRESGKDL